MPDDASHPLSPPSDQVPSLPIGLPMARPVTMEAYIEPPHPIMLMGEARRRVWADVLIVIGLVVVCELAVGMLVALAVATVEGAGEQHLETLFARFGQELIVRLLAFRAISACLVVYLVARARGQSMASLGLTWRPWWVQLIIGGLAATGAYGVSVITIQILFRFYPGMQDQMFENAERLKDMIPPMGPLAYAPFAMLIGVYEEVLFRGFLLPRLRRATGSWFLSVVLSTAMFTALHAGDQTTPALISISILSLTFSGLTIWRRSIVPAIVAHALWNFTMFLFLLAV